MQNRTDALGKLVAGRSIRQDEARTTGADRRARLDRDGRTVSASNITQTAIHAALPTTQK
ncbi:MAG TPA: hypothetical protein VLI06_20815 [Solimonas sp.]|nr:hypothetical protein [Solimonas sp.]